MTTRIEQLTRKQIAMLDTVRNEWLGHGLATGPADRVQAEEGVRLAYQAAGLTPPRIVIWLDSPLAGAIGAELLSRMPKEISGAQVRDQVWVPKNVVEDPASITLDSIEKERNAEVRRVMIERYGLGRYVRDAQFEVLDADIDPVGQPRRLIRRDNLVVVELTNSTEDYVAPRISYDETDVDIPASRRKYHVQCHPELRPLLPNNELGDPQKLTALNAVASTYGMTGAEYVLEMET